jgi:hypothetical protein
MASPYVLPECWDGKSLNSEDHSSHVRYMNGRMLLPLHPTHTEVPGPLQCWANHTEYRARVEASDLFSTGDNTGASMHSDFISGWDEVLADLLRGCSKTLATVRSWANLSSAPSRSRPTLSTYLDKYIPKGSLRMQGRLLTKITDVACLRVTMDVFKRYITSSALCIKKHWPLV